MLTVCKYGRKKILYQKLLILCKGMTDPKVPFRLTIVTQLGSLWGYFMEIESTQRYVSYMEQVWF